MQNHIKTAEAANGLYQPFGQSSFTSIAFVASTNAEPDKLITGLASPGQGTPAMRSDPPLCRSENGAKIFHLDVAESSVGLGQTT